MIGTARCVLVLIGATAVTLTAQGSAGARFQYERIAEAAGNGPQRLDVDVALLTGSQPFAVEDRGNRWIARRGLGDLRLFDQHNVEVPYLLIEPSPDQPVFSTSAALTIPPVEKPDNKTSGFEVDTRSVIDSPRYDLQLLSGQVLGRTAEDVTAGPEEVLSGGVGVSGFELVPPMVFWAFLGVTVIVLIGLVVRLMKKEAL